ncbi:MAG: ketopantoate reductase family protein [Halanaeroarchaeum sp.]
MHVAVLGAGALGSLVAARLARTEATVTIVGRPSHHFDAVRENGLVLRTPDGGRQSVAVDATTEYPTVGAADFLVLTVKSYDTAEAMADVADHLGDADVLTLQNGLGNAETIADFVAPERVVAGTTTHGAVLPEPGVVRHAGTGETRVGRYFAPNDERVAAIADLLSEAAIETAVVEDVADAVWEKVLVNVGINAATALARVPNGRLLESAAGERVLARAVEEAAAVAVAEGRAVPEDVVQRTRAVARATATNRSSMRQDVEGGSRTEIESLNGAVVSRARDHGLETPVNRTLADLVRLTETGAED